MSNYGRITAEEKRQMKRNKLRKLLTDKEELEIWENFTEQEEAEFKTVFDIFDTDGGGEIEENEIRMVFQSLGQNPT